VNKAKKKNTCFARGAKDSRERMVAAINSSQDDLFLDGNGRVVVTGKTCSGERIYLGEVSETLLCRKDIDPISLINKVRFHTNMAFTQVTYEA